MENELEKIIKIAILFILVLAFVLYWLLPKTRFAKRLKMNETLFIITNVIGIACGVIGLVVTFVYPYEIVEFHLWELIILPFALVYGYWLLIIRIRKSSEIVDEKQDYNMTKAAAMTMAFSIPAMVVMFMLYYNDIFAGPTWFPYYLFVTVLFFCGITLYLFKKE